MYELLRAAIMHVICVRFHQLQRTYDLLLLLGLSLSFSVALTTTSSAAGTAPENEESRLNDADTKLLALASRFVRLRNQLEAEIKAQEEAKKTIQILKWDLEEVFGPPCGSEFQCGEESIQCVANYLVCDGTPDCDNGADEIQCDIPLKVGTRFEDIVTHVTCPGDIPESITGEIISIDRLPWFPSLITVQMTFNFTKTISGSVISASFRASSEYRPATHDWKQYMGGLRHEQMVLITRYHGNKRFTRTMYRAVNMEPCARGIRILTS